MLHPPEQLPEQLVPQATVHVLSQVPPHEPVQPLHVLPHVPTHSPVQAPLHDDVLAVIDSFANVSTLVNNDESNELGIAPPTLRWAVFKSPISIICTNGSITALPWSAYIGCLEAGVCLKSYASPE